MNSDENATNICTSQKQVIYTDEVRTLVFGGEIITIVVCKNII